MKTEAIGITIQDQDSKEETDPKPQKDGSREDDQDLERAENEGMVQRECAEEEPSPSAKS